LNILQKNRDHRLQFAGIFFLFFFFVYSINFTFLPAYTSQLIALAVIVGGLIFLIERDDDGITIEKGTQILFFIWFVYFLWVLSRSVFSEFRDIGLLANTLLLLVQVFVGSLFFALWFYKKGYSFKNLVRFIQLIMVLQGVFIIVYFFSMDFKLFTIAIIPEGGNLPALHPYRSRGLTHQASATLAGFQATGILFTAYLIVKSKSWKLFIFDVVALGILTASVLFTGRTGFIIFPFVIGFVGVYILYRSAVSRKVLASITLFPVLVVGGFYLMEALYAKYFGGGTGQAFTMLTQWAFGELGDLFTEGGSRTTDALIQEHLFFPDSWKIFLMGDPTTYSLYRIPSDIGFVRWIFGIGLIGLILMYTMVAYICREIFKKAPGVPEKILVVVFTIWIFVLEFKEPFLSDFRFATLYMVFYCFLCIAPLQKINLFRLKQK